MAKLDRLGWAGGLAFRSYGRSIGIRFNDPEARERILQCLPPAWQAAESPAVDRLYSLIVGKCAPESRIRVFHLLYAGLNRLSRSLLLDDAFDHLETDLQLYVAERASRRCFIHAGVVAWNDTAIVIPGRSHSGKSTLVAALLKAGATYYSDEYAVLDALGRVHPYPRLLSIRQPDGERPWRRSAEALGARTGLTPLPVGLVVVTAYQAGQQWRPRHLPRGRAMLALLGNAVSARRQPTRVLAALERVVAQAPVLQGPRGEADQAVGRLLDRFSRRRAWPSNTSWAQ
jgi:hypothetical protein